MNEIKNMPLNQLIFELTEQQISEKNIKQMIRICQDEVNRRFKEGELYKIDIVEEIEKSKGGIF